MFVKSLSTTAVLAFALTSVPARAATVINGTFDDNAAAYVVWPGYNGATGAAGTNPSNPTGWTFTGGSGINPVFPDGAGQAPFNDGTNTGAFAFLQGESRMEQSIGGFTVGGSYTLNLSFNARNCCGPEGQPAPTPLAEVYLNDVLLASSAALFPAPGGVIPGSVANGGNWYSAGLPFTAAADTILLSIRARPAAGGDTTLIVDNVSIVPEPAMASLLACGLLGALVRRRR
jgi:hypothetical protein